MGKIGKIGKIENLIAALKREITDPLLSGADNPKIQRLSGQPNCFIMSSASLGNNWSPFYHDFHEQYRTLAEIIGKTRLEFLASVLGNICEKNTYWDGNRNIKFHPDVIDHLKNVLNKN
jgi:hypothetical protein